MQAKARGSLSVVLPAVVLVLLAVSVAIAFGMTAAEAAGTIRI